MLSDGCSFMESLESSSMTSLTLCFIFNIVLTILESLIFYIYILELTLLPKASCNFDWDDIKCIDRLG